MDNATINERRLAALPRGVAVACEFFAARAENATLWDVEGRAFTDFAAGVAVLNTGHRHPAVMAAVTRQLESFTHTAFSLIPYESAVALAERINRLAPIAGPAKTAFFTTGAEAVENAIKIARAATGRPGIIAFSGGFHGRTSMGMALTGKVTPYKSGFGPFPADVYRVPFPSELAGVSVEHTRRALTQLFQCDIAPSAVAAIIVEPVQGEGGFNVAPASLFEMLRALCDEHGILLVADEIQTGFGRTGKMFAMEHYTVSPDLVTMAKSLAGGLPLSAVCGRSEIMDAPAPGGLGGTYAANPLSVAASHAVIDAIEREGLAKRADALGMKLRKLLLEERVGVRTIADVRGLGSMMAVEFAEPTTGAPSARTAQRVQQLALARGLVLLTCGLHGNVIRFLYPLTIPDSQFDQALLVLSECLRLASAGG